MSEEAARKALASSARKWVKATEAKTQWMQDHIAFWWPESGEPAPPEPKLVTQAALDEYERLTLEEQEAKQQFARATRELLGRS
jgi:1,2-phenylacetyl-CoA epoxidase catalytic subunit